MSEQNTSKQVRVADLIVSLLAKHGIKDVFLVTGGGAMHLNDAFGRSKDIHATAFHHEQACAMAAESYTRMSGRLCAVNVTTGPGGTNALTGVYGAYVDSVGMIVISGQVKFETTIHSTDLPLRQLGDQEIDIIRVVKPITKHALMITDPKQVVYEVQKAIYLAESGRPGPVWLDVPMNVQGALVDPSQLKQFDPAELKPIATTDNLDSSIAEMLKKLAQAKRPVLMCGGGIRASKSYSKFLSCIERLGIPVATCWNAHDLLWDNHPLYVGRPGIIGDRAGNFAVQNSDFILILGSRLNMRQVSYAWESFARAAYKVMVDIDAAEMQKPTLKINLPIHADLNQFFDRLEKSPSYKRSEDHAKYLSWCKQRVEKYGVVLPEYWKNKESVNPYCFASELFQQLKEGDRVVTGDGTACVVTFQAAKIRQNQRLYTNSGCASMGYDIPAAIGACLSNDRKPIVCIAGDGSMQMNIQELQTIVTQNLPIKIFVLNNKGYHSIRQTQQAYFPDNIVGCGTESGLGFPDLNKLASAYGIPFRRIQNHDELKEGIQATLSASGFQICEIILDLNQQFAPKLASRKLPDGRMVSSPLEDLFPFLSREELRENMIIPMVES